MNKTAYRRDSTVPSVYPNPKLIIRENRMMAIREMAVAAVAAPMVMALGVLLITPKRLAGFCSLLY